MMGRSLGVLGIVVALAACGDDAVVPSPPGQPADPVTSSPPSSSSPPGPSVEDTPAPPAPQGADPPCPKSPCTERPIIFIHGINGSNDDGKAIFDALMRPGERWDSRMFSGTEDHAKWPTKSIPRRGWLFSFDYYLRTETDARGTFTAGPGRIGSDGSFSCPDPAGKSKLTPDSSSYDEEVTHDYSSDLANMVDDVLRATGATKVDIVAHSMGGLVTRAYLAFLGGNEKVERVMLLASPHLGVTFAPATTPFIGQPWMNAHELTELDTGSWFARSKFTRCGSGSTEKDSWPKQLLAWETANPVKPAFHCMSGTKDLLVSRDSAHHPQCADHIELDGADHTGVLSASVTSDRVRLLLGGYVMALPTNAGEAN